MEWLAKEPQCFHVNITPVREAEEKGADGRSKAHAGRYHSHLQNNKGSSPDPKLVCFVTEMLLERAKI